MSRIPSLGARGGGWVLLQIVAWWLVIATTGIDRVDVSDPTVRSAVIFAGTILLVVGIILLLSAAVMLRGSGAFTVFPRPKDGAGLVESGPYRFVRHPVYAGLVLSSIGFAVSRFAPVSLAAAVVLFVILDLKRRREEAWLVQRFPAYEIYQGRTKALIPFVY